jgi:hypothetical protein
VKVRYFGKWSPTSSGHHWYTPRAASDYDTYERIKGVVGASVDGSQWLLPGAFRVTRGYVSAPPEDKQQQGLFRHTVWNDDGVSVSCLAAWDRTADQRSGSNSQFWVWGTADRDEAERLARESFPQQWARLDAAKETP